MPYIAWVNTKKRLGMYMSCVCPITIHWHVWAYESHSFLAMGLRLHITVPCGINLKVLYSGFNLNKDLLGFYPLLDFLPLPYLLPPTPWLVFHGNTFLINYLPINPCFSICFWRSQPKTSAITCWKIWWKTIIPFIINHNKNVKCL